MEFYGFFFGLVRFKKDLEEKSARELIDEHLDPFRNSAIATADVQGTTTAIQITTLFTQQYRLLPSNSNYQINENT